VGQIIRCGAVHYVGQSIRCGAVHYVGQTIRCGAVHYVGQTIRCGAVHYVGQIIRCGALHDLYGYNSELHELHRNIACRRYAVLFDIWFGEFQDCMSCIAR
jgi:hypothetical protein